MSTTIFQKDFTGIDAAAIVASMVGSGRNIDSVGIPIGAPVFEDASGNVRLASATYPAFAVALTGAPKGGVVSYRTDGQVERADWSPITRTALLVVGATYFVSGTGGLDTTGFQQVGVAVSPTVLRVTIQATATVAATSFVLSNTNGVSFGTNGSTVTASIFTNYLTGFNVSDGSTSSNVTGLVFSNTNGVSFGLSSNTLTASVATSLSNINVSAGTTSQNLSKLLLSNSNGVSFGLNGSTVTASVATSLTNMNVSAGTTSNNLSAVTFSNSNGLAFGLNGSVITGSYTVPAQSNQTVGLYASSNTTLTSSGTQDARSLSFRAIGSLTVGYSAGEVLLSAPNALTTAMQSNAVTLSNVNLSAGTTSNNLSAMVFSNSNNFSFGLSGSTITASYTVPTVPAWMGYGDVSDPIVNFRPQVPQPGKCVEVYGTGMGFCLFRTKMFQDPRLPRPLFRTKAGKDGCGTQDLMFFAEARKYGYRAAIDSDCKVGHYDLEGKFGPADTMW